MLGTRVTRDVSLAAMFSERKIPDGRHCPLARFATKTSTCCSRSGIVSFSRKASPSSQAIVIAELACTHHHGQLTTSISVQSDPGSASPQPRRTTLAPTAKASMQPTTQTSTNPQASACPVSSCTLVQVPARSNVHRPSCAACTHVQDAQRLTHGFRLSIVDASLDDLD